MSAWDTWSRAGRTGALEEVHLSMLSAVPVAKKLLIGTVAVGVLTLGGTGIAGAAAPSPSTPATPATPHAASFDCSRAPKALARIGRLDAHIAAGFPKLTAREAKARQDGQTARADRLAKLLSHLESAKFKAHLAKVSQRIEATCHVTAPATPSPSSAPTTAG
jgi:hypothetical protein